MTSHSFSRLSFIWILTVLLASGCGSAADEDPTIAPPDPGQRFFKGSDTEYFGPDSKIVTIDPELGYRPDLELHRDVYWLPDAISKRKTFVDATTVKIPLTSNTDPVLGYKPGMVLINKYWPIRHRLISVDASDTQVTWTVAEAAYDEVIRVGDIYTVVPDDQGTPVAFDVLDPWLYEDRKAQLAEIQEKYLESELIKMMATPESIESMREDYERRTAAKQRAKNSPTNLDTRRQAMDSVPEWCGSINSRELECEDLFEVGGVDFDACKDQEVSCEDLYPDTPDDPDGSQRAECEEAKAQGDFDQPQLLVCDAFVRNNIDLLSAQGVPSESPASWDHQHCIDEERTLMCNDIVYLNDGTCSTLDLGLPGIEMIPLCPLFRPNPNLNESVEFICENLCQFEDEEHDRGGGASADDWSAGVGVCVNSKAFGGDKCRARFGPKFEFDIEISGASDDPEDDGTPPPEGEGDGDGDGDGGSSIEFPVKVTLTPVFTAAVGFKAKMRIRPFWAGVKVGFFAGIGIGAVTKVELEEQGVRWTKNIDLLEKAGIEPEIPLPPILFLTFFLRPAGDLTFFAEASVQGSITHKYFQERGFVICIAAKAGAGPGKGSWPSTGIYRGQEAADKCGMDPYPESENINEIETEEPTGFEVRAGLELGIGIELVLKISGTVEIGALYFYPFVVRISIGATVRPPRCTFDISVTFGWRFGGYIEIRISKFSIPIASFHHSDSYPNPKYRESFPIKILPGCGVIEPPEPAEYEGNYCPPGPDPDDPDGNCLELPHYEGKDARCFVERCVEQDAMRVSLAWNDPRQDLDLYVRDPDGIVYDATVFERTSCGATCGGSCSDDPDCLNGWICEGGQCQPEDPTYIENFVGTIGKTGTWEAWVVRHAEGDALDDEVLFDLEFENSGSAPMRKATRGSVEGGDDGAPVMFLFCIGEECP